MALLPFHSELNAKSRELHLQISEDGQSSEGGWSVGGRRPCSLEGSSSGPDQGLGVGRAVDPAEPRPLPLSHSRSSQGNVWLKVHSVTSKVKHCGKEYIQLVLFFFFFFFFLNKYPKSFIQQFLA